MKYVTYISNWYIPKNGLERAITAYLRTQERVVIDPEQLGAFKKMVADKVDELSAANKRCTPIKCAWREAFVRIKDLPHYEDWRITLNGHDSICIFNIYAVPNEFVLPGAKAAPVLHRGASKGLSHLLGTDNGLGQLLNQLQEPAPNQLNLLDEIEVARKSVAIGYNTTAIDIIEAYAPKLHPVAKEQMSTFLDKLVDHKVEVGQVRKFNSRLEHERDGRKVTFDVPKAIMDDINHIADRATIEQKARLMRLSLEDINELKRKKERELIDELRNLLNQELVDIYDSQPICLPFFLAAIDEKVYTKEKLMRLLSQGKISVQRIERMIEAIRKEYKPVDLFANEEVVEQ